jgi:hypothetical protein
MPLNIGGNQVVNTRANQLINTSPVFSGLMYYLDAGLVSSYPGSGTTWTEFTGNYPNNPGSLTNGPTFSTGNGGYISLDGTNDYIDCGSIPNTFIGNPTLNGNIISFGCWCYAIDGLYILSSGAQTSETGVSFSYQNGTPFYAIKGTNVEGLFYISNPSTNFPTNTWIYWMFVSDGSTMKAYKNGIYLEQGTLSAGSFTDEYTNLTLGTPNNAVGSYLFNGRIGSVQIYNKALTAAEILQNYQSQRQRYGL